MLAHKYFPENTKERVYFSGFMVMNLELMRENRAVERYFEGIEWLGHRLKFFDLDLVNVLTQKIAQLPFDYVVLEDIYEVENIEESREFGFLNSVYSVQDLEAARQDPAIIHYAGPRGKPWQRQQVPRYYQEVWSTACRRSFSARPFGTGVRHGCRRKGANAAINAVTGLLERQPEQAVSKDDKAKTARKPLRTGRQLGEV